MAATGDNAAASQPAQKSSRSSAVAETKVSALAGLKEKILGTAAVLFLRCLTCTWRWTFIGPLTSESFWADGAPRIFVTWHGRQLMTGPFIRYQSKGVTRPPIIALISKHMDGRIAARVMRWCDIDSVAGSSSRGAIEGGRKLIDALKHGNDIGLTPDGPRGPNQKSKPGVIRIAQLTGATIYPLAASAKSHWRFRSWDRMLVPKPFARVVAIRGEGLRVPRELNEEQVNEYVQKLDALINKATETVDAEVGVPNIL